MGPVTCDQGSIVWDIEETMIKHKAVLLVILLHIKLLHIVRYEQICSSLS